MSTIFNEILYRPLFNGLIFFYNNIPVEDLGIAIILLTIFIRLILFPLFYKGAKDQAIMQRISPKIREIQNAHKQDKEKQARALMDLYREHKINPLSGFLLILVQLPVLIALYKVFLNGFSVESLDSLYSFISRPASLERYFLGVIDLTQRDIFIVVGAAVAQYFQGKLSLPPKNGIKKDLAPAEAMGRQMLYLGPILTVVFLYFFKLPSAVGLYWLTTSVFSVIQQIFINRRITQNKLYG